MSRFGNEYLAESVGYATGHGSGLAVGRKAGQQEGYTQGWNDAVTESNQVINRYEQKVEEQKTEIARLTNEIYKGNAYIKELRDELARVSNLADRYHADRDDYVERFKQQRYRAQRLTEICEAHGLRLPDDL